MLYSKPLQGIGLWRSCKRHIGGISPHFPTSHGLQNDILSISVIFFHGVLRCPHRLIHLSGGNATLTAVGFIDDYSKPPITHIGDAVHDKRKLLNRRDNNLLPLSKDRFKSTEELAGATIFFTSENSRIFSFSCLSKSLRSVTTITESNKGFAVPLLPGIVSDSG